MALTRRKFLKLLAALSGLTVCSSGYGLAHAFWLEPSWVEVTRINVPLPNLPPALDGLTICQISDLHVGPRVSSEQIRHVVDLITATSPQLVAITGDYVSRSAQYIYTCAAELGRLRAPLGVYASLGNNDHWTNASVVTAGLQDAGLTVLRNAGQLVKTNGAALWLAGVDDVWERHANLPLALADAPVGAPVVLLAHEPDYADTVAADGRVGLQLAGHSHGGQVRLPFIGAPVLPYLGKKYPYGLRRVGQMWLYTNRGIGVVGLPVRFNCRPEITLIRLVDELEF